jgi:hypothetical protein
MKKICILILGIMVGLSPVYVLGQTPATQKNTTTDYKFIPVPPDISKYTNYQTSDFISGENDQKLPIVNISSVQLENPNKTSKQPFMSGQFDLKVVYNNNKTKTEEILATRTSPIPMDITWSYGRNSNMPQNIIVNFVDEMTKKNDTMLYNLKDNGSYELRYASDPGKVYNVVLDAATQNKLNPNLEAANNSAVESVASPKKSENISKQSLPQ